MNRTTRGIGMIEILVGFALMGILSSVFFALFGSLGKMQSRTTTVAGAEIVRSNLLAMVQHRLAWKATVQEPRNTSLACLRTGSDCRDVTGPIVVLKDLSNADFYDARPDESGGFREDGSYCTSYASSGSPNCPFHPTLTWTAVCPPVGSACTAPQIRITAQLAYAPGTTAKATPFNEKTRGFDIYLGSQGGFGPLSPDLDTGWLRVFPAPMSPGISHVPAVAGYVVDFTQFSSTLGSDPSTFLVDLQLNWNGPLGTLLAIRGGGLPAQWALNNCGGIETGWRRLTATSVVVDQLDNCFSTLNPLSVRVRVWDTSRS